jgi:hypothetical protein
VESELAPGRGWVPRGGEETGWRGTSPFPQKTTHPPEERGFNSDREELASGLDDEAGISVEMAVT